MEITSAWIEAQWPLSAVRVGERFGSREAYAISASEGEFVLKVTGEWTSRADVDRTTGIPAFLRAKGLDCAPPVLPARTGEAYQSLGERFAYLMQSVPGTKLPATPPGYRRLGKVAAALHALTDYPGECPLSAVELRPQMLKAASRFPFAAEYAVLIESLPPLERDGLPVGLIHPDLHPDHVIVRPDLPAPSVARQAGLPAPNVARQAGGTIVLVDWDESGTGIRILDVGQPLISTFVTENLVFLREEARAFYAAYCETITLTSPERDLIFPAALFFALWYLPMGGSASARWERIKYAMRRRDELLTVIPPP